MKKILSLGIIATLIVMSLSLTGCTTPKESPFNLGEEMKEDQTEEEQIQIENIYYTGNDGYIWVETKDLTTPYYLIDTTGKIIYKTLDKPKSEVINESTVVNDKVIDINGNVIYEVGKNNVTSITYVKDGRVLIVYTEDSFEGKKTEICYHLDTKEETDTRGIYDTSTKEKFSFKNNNGYFTSYLDDKQLYEPIKGKAICEDDENYLVLAKLEDDKYYVIDKNGNKEEVKFEIPDTAKNFQFYKNVVYYYLNMYEYKFCNINGDNIVLHY